MGFSIDFFHHCYIKYFIIDWFENKLFSPGREYDPGSLGLSLFSDNISVYNFQNFQYFNRNVKQLTRNHFEKQNTFKNLEKFLHLLQ